jgi:hypothetical protein
MKTLKIVIGCLLALVCTYVQSQGFVPHYRMEKNGAITSVTAPWGSWSEVGGGISTPPGTLMPPWATSMDFQFEFVSSNYFIPGGPGHFALGLRADRYTDEEPANGIVDLRGKGIIIGDVGGYNPLQPGCAPATGPRAVVVESFWAGGNCVYGNQTSAPLENNERYRIKLTTAYNYWYANVTIPGAWNKVVVTYRIDRFDGSQWVFHSADAVVDQYTNMSPLNLGGWFLIEVFSNHNWVVDLYNVEWSYNYYPQGYFTF